MFQLRKIYYFFASIVNHIFVALLAGKHGNKMIIVDERGEEHVNCLFPFVNNLLVDFKSTNCTVMVMLPAKFSCAKIQLLASDSVVTIGKNSVMNGFHVYCSHSSYACAEQVDTEREACGKLRIGDGVTVENNLSIRLSDKSSVSIGDDCMFASNIFIRAADAHPIFNKSSGLISNEQRNVLSIGKHCWIGQNVLIGKNVQIPDNNIIGMGSVVVGKFNKEYTAIAGNPAKVVKEDVQWKR
jgi:acetyltransferase-like isoleucine patch superfamily enzyme